MGRVSHITKLDLSGCITARYNKIQQKGLELTKKVWKMAISMPCFGFWNCRSGKPPYLDKRNNNTRDLSVWCTYTCVGKWDVIEHHDLKNYRRSQNCKGKDN